MAHSSRTVGPQTQTGILNSNQELMSAVRPQSNKVQGPQHNSGQEIDGRLPGGRIGRKVAEHQLFIEE